MYYVCKNLFNYLFNFLKLIKINTSIDVTKLPNTPLFFHIDVCQPWGVLAGFITVQLAKALCLLPFTQEPRDS